MRTTVKQTDVIARFSWENIVLTMYWDGAMQGGKSRIDYQFEISGKTIMEGNDFCTREYPDSIETVVSLLGFLTVAPGDTDAEYFANHTSEMLDWLDSAQRDCLNLEISDYEQGEAHGITFFKTHTEINPGE